MDASTLAGHEVVALTTLDARGGEITSPVWVVLLSDGRLGLPAREGAEPRVRVQACDPRGRPLEDAEARAGRAEQVRSGGLFEEARGRLREKYGWRARLGSRRADTIVLVTLDPPVAAGPPS